MKQNCWEIKRCGREPGGVNISKFGVCPAAEKTNADGINGGKNGGRICWAVSGTLCGGKIQGNFAKKQLNCMGCEFFKQVQSEEGANFHLLLSGQVYQFPRR